MTKIDPEFKAEWVAALRSGKYTQGQRGLVDTENNYCCLGVAVCLRPELVERDGEDFYVNDVEIKRQIMCTDYPPYQFADLYLGGKNDPRILISDIPESFDVTGDEDEFVTLSELNDDKNKTFLEIADIIDLCL